MPVYYSDNNEIQLPTLPNEPKGLTVDIGGDTRLSTLQPHEELAKKFGVAIEDTVKTGIGIGSSIPGVKEVTKAVADSPIGDAAGSFFDILNIPSEIVQGIAARMRMGADDLPMDIKNMIAMGKSDDEIVKYMIDTQRSFSNDRSANLLFSILLDPLNFTPLALGKVRYLKTLTGLTGGVAGGALGGTLLAGPVGTLGGALVGSTLAARKFTSKMDKIRDAATAAEKADDMPKLSALESALNKLDRPVGYDAMQKLRTGSSMTAAIDKANEVISEVSRSDADEAIKADRIRVQKAEISNSEEAMKSMGAISNPIALGIYNGIVGGKNTILSPIQKRISLAVFGSAEQGMFREAGGAVVNETADIISDGMLSQHKTQLQEQLGRGMAALGIGGIQRAMFTMENTLGLKIANRRAEAYFAALNKVSADEAAGAVFTNKNEAIADEMIRMATEASGNANEYFRTTSRAEVLSTIDRLQTTALPDALRAGPKTTQAIQDIGAEISNQLIEARVQTSRIGGGSLEEIVLDQIRKVGADGFAAEGGSELRRAIQEIIPRVSSKAAAKSEFTANMKSIFARYGVDPNAPATMSAIDDKFERIFGKLFDEGGQLAKNESATEVARRLLVTELSSYSTANSAAAEFNRTMAGLLDTNSNAFKKLAEEIGPENASKLAGTLEVISKNIGKIHVARQGFMFRGKVVALINVWDEIAAASDTAVGKIDRTDVRVSGLVPEVNETVGTIGDVQKIRTLIVDKITKARRSTEEMSTEYIDMLKKLNTKLGEAKNLADVRRIWQETAYNSLDDVRASMGNLNKPADLHQFLKQALDEGLVIDPLTKAEQGIVEAAMNLMKINPEVMSVFTKGGAYRLARQPQGNLMSRAEVIRHSDPTQMRNIMMRRRIAPYIDMTSHHFDDVAMEGRYNLSRFQHIMNTIFSPIGQDAVAASIRRRMASYMARGGVGENQIEAILDELLVKAIEQKISPRGLDHKVIYDAFKRGFEATSGPGSFEAFKRNWKLNSISDSDFEPVKALMHSFRGDTNVVGLTQAATGTAKEWSPWIAGWTDKWYPNLKFRLNPMYFVQEFLESPTLNSARGVDSTVLSGITSDGKAYYISAGEAKDLAVISPEAHAIIDNNNFLAVFREDMLKQALTGRYEDVVAASGSLKNSRLARGWDDLSQRKEAQRDALTLNLTAQQFSDSLMKNNPEFWAALVSHYGLKDPRDVFVNFVEFRRSLSNPERIATQIDLARPAAFGYSKVVDPKMRIVSDVENLLFRNIPIGGRLPVDDADILDVLSTYEVAAKNAHKLRPDVLADNISIAQTQLRDGAYDMSSITPALDDLKLTAVKMKQHRITNPNDEYPAELLAEYEQKIGNVKSSFGAAKFQARIAEHRFEATQELMRLAGFATVDGQLTQETANIAQALAMGAGYGGDITGISTVVDKTVRELISRGLFVGSKEFTNELVMEVRRKFGNDAKTLKLLSDASYQLVARHGSEEIAYRAFQYVYNKTLEEANRVHYVNTKRSFFERTINHPVLGFYPYTYMFKKILPEMMAFMFKRPFGVTAPFAGYQAYSKIREYVEYELENDYELKTAIESKPETMFMLTSLFPGVPWDISVVPPSWLRAVSRRMSGQSDKDVDLFSNILQEDILDRTTNIGGPAAIGRAFSVGSELMSSSEQPILEQAEYKIPRIP